MGRLRHILGGIEAAHGFFPVEVNALGPFVWTTKRFGIRRDPQWNLYSVNLCYYGDNGNLYFRGGNGAGADMTLHRGWHTYPLDLSPFGEGEIDVYVEPWIPDRSYRRSNGTTSTSR